MRKVQVLKRVIVKEGVPNPSLPKYKSGVIYGLVPNYIGAFEEWGIDAEEGIGSYTAAIVLKDSGFVELVEPSLVCFIVDNYNMYGAQFKAGGVYYRFGPDNLADVWDKIKGWVKPYKNILNPELLGDDYTPVT